MQESPLPLYVSTWAVARCIGMTAGLLLRGKVHAPGTEVGRRLSFADGTTARVYRDTVLDRPAPRDPCLLVVEFRLRGVHGRAHALFRYESMLNIPLFVGFPGFVSKLWLAHDDHGVYRGLYEWDGPESAARYARSLWWVLALVSHRGSIDYRVVPRLARPDVLGRSPAWTGATTDAGPAWWRAVDVA